MGLDAIVRAIASEAESQVAATRAQAQSRISKTLAEAREAAAAEERAWASSRDEEAKRASARIINRARLDADRQLAQAREELYQEALYRLRAFLRELVASPRYGDVLRALYAEASSLLAGPEIVILVRPEDRDLMAQILAESEVGGRVEALLECLGGLDIEASDGRAVRNTLDARLAKCERHLRRLTVSTVPEMARVGS